MKLAWKLFFVLLFTAGLLVACGDDEETTSDPEDTDGSVEEEATEPDEVEEPEGDEPENNEHVTEENEVEKEEAQATEDEYTLEATEYEDQQLQFGETSIYESTAVGTFEITPHTIRKESELQGEVAPIGDWVIVETTLTNIGDVPTKDEIPLPVLIDDVGPINAYGELSADEIGIDVNELKYYHEGRLEPGETVELDFLFAVDRFNDYEFVFGTEIDHHYSNRVAWKIDASELE